MTPEKSRSTSRSPSIGHRVAIAVLGAFAMHAYADAAATSARTVDITKFAFTPADITITPGSRIVWINHDEVPHTVTSEDKQLVSKAMDTDDRYEHVFAEEGDYVYHCAVHPFMIGVVHVRKD